MRASTHAKRILVTGGAGFIGSHTVELLLAQGHEVLVLDNLSSGKITHLPMTHANLEFIEGDVLEYPYLAELVASVQAVLHLAAIVSVPVSIENPIYTFQVNTQATLHVLEAIRAAKAPIRCVFASSAAVYGDPHTLPCEDGVALRAPAISPYGLQKIQCEDYADLYSRLFNIPSLALRYFNVYGTRQDPSSPYSGVISKFMQAHDSQEALTIFGSGEQTRDFIHVSDVAKANALALTSDVAGVLNIATGVATSINELAAMVSEVAGQPLNIQRMAQRAGDIPASYASTSRAKETLSFSAAMSLRDGLAEMLGHAAGVASQQLGNG